MNSLFITGASGFIGSRLLHRLDAARYDHIYCLSRKASTIQEYLGTHHNVLFVPGDLYASSLYAPYLASSDIVIHLAAATGKALPEEYFSVNAKGTQFLIEQCQRAGTKHFLYVSTIAVKYPDKSHYYYAQSKELGEDAVRSSGLNYSIIRPTIVIGQNGSTWRSLSNLAKLPLTPIFGDGATNTQPIYLDDLVDCLLSILNEPMFSNETFEIGGPEVTTVENLIRAIRLAYDGKEPRLVHIPLRPLVRLLSILEKRFYSLLPINVGQLSAFSNEGTIETNRLFDRQAPRMKGVQQMLKLVTNQP